MSPVLTRAGLGLAVGLSFAAVPVAADASAVDLGTAKAFVVLGGSTVTNTGPSVLGGDLGVSPGTALVGFGPPATVNGTSHAADAVALQAQADLATAYDVAAGQPVAPADDLTGTDLGGRTLTAGAYRFSSSAQLTGQVTLDAQGDPAAQFVVEVASSLITASSSSVRLVNGASACNVFWQVGSSATLGTATAFQGNVLALTSITLNTGATATGRLLARNGAVTLDSNTLTRPTCAASSTTPAGPGTPTAPGTTAPATGSLPGSPTTTAGPGGATPRGRTTLTVQPRGTCTGGFRAAVQGRRIKRVVFSIDGRRLGVETLAPFRMYFRAAPGGHTIRARATYTDGARARSMTFRFRACAAAVLRPRRGPSVFTG